MSGPISYAHGTTLSPLIGETIGSNFDRVVSSHPERDALFVPHQDVRLELPRASDSRQPAGRRADCDSRSVMHASADGTS